MRAVLALLLLAVSAATAAAGSTALKRDADGHWRADSRVNGRRIEMLVDTGATLVALTPADARTVGINVRRLDYDTRVETANGTARAARVTLERVQIGGVRVRYVKAMVIERGLSTSLLGQSFLNRLETYQVRGQLLRLQD